MLKRKITKILSDWKNEPDKPCLLVRGARQVGKTFIIEQFARENYDYYIYINFELMPSMKKIFDGDLDFRTLRLNLEANFPGVKIEKGKTLLFLDEIGACPNARVALKTFAMDGTLDTVASGSLLGLQYREVSSYPVGYERTVEMYSLDFEEFLWAMGVSEEVIQASRDSFERIEMLPESISDKLASLFRQYILVGGMPAAVNAYLETESLNAVREVQKSLIEDYKSDVMKYAPTTDKQKILRTFESVPAQLAKKNKKFMWVDIEEGNAATGERKYGSALAWLKDAGIVNFCYNLSTPVPPLKTRERTDAYKVYMRDTGLLMAMLEPGMTKGVLEGDNMVDEGGITENVIAGELLAHGHDLMYFERKGKLKIDFVLNLDGNVTVIEAKSGNHTQAKSLKSMMENYQTVRRYIKLEKDVSVRQDESGVEHYPLFMGMWV